jgi:glutaredoxin/glutathione-dependent peroxiredoxin
MAVNDAFVMNAWARDQDVPPDVMMLSDGNGAFGMGTRSKRFALVADDGVVTQLHVEAPGEFRVSAAEHVLAGL